MDNAFLLRCQPISNYGGTSAMTNTLNIFSDKLGRAARFTNAGANYMEIDFGASVPLDTFALLATNAVFGDTVRWRLAATQAALTSGPVYDSGAVSLIASPEGWNDECIHRQSLHHITSGPVAARWARFDLVAANAGLTVGRFTAGKAWKPADTIDYGWEIEVIDRGSVEVSPLGVKSAQILPRRLMYRASWAWLTQAEARAASLALWLYAGATRPLMLCVDSSASDRHNLIGFGLLKNAYKTAQIATDGYAASVELESELQLFI